MELTKYIEANRTLLEQAPFGLYAVVPPQSDYQQIVPGVIFCLKQFRRNTTGNENGEPTATVFSGVRTERRRIVRYTFAQPEANSGNLSCVVCREDRYPYETLCDLFDKETMNGAKHQPLVQRNDCTSGFDSVVHTLQETGR